MKKIGLLAVLLTACGILAQAATLVNCTVITGGIVTSVGNVAKIDAGGTLVSTPVFSCPGLDAGAGSTLSSVSLLGTGDYDGGPFGTITGTSVTEIFGVTSGPFSPAAPVVLTITGGNSSNNTSIPVPFELGAALNPGTQTLASFTVNLSSAVTAGTVAESSAQMVLIYSTVPTTSGVPEPATLGLMGSALLGLGFLARRKKS